MKFLCNCELDQKITSGYTLKFDPQGFAICPEHGAREYGWRTKLDILLGRTIDPNRSVTNGT